MEDGGIEFFSVLLMVILLIRLCVFRDVEKVEPTERERRRYDGRRNGGGRRLRMAEARFFK